MLLLALMLVRMALRPISKTRSLCRLFPGFRAVPLVHIASPSPSMRIALRRNLVPAELVGSGRMSGRRPVVKGLVEALRTLRVRSCLRPVVAGNECPAGPDAGPHGSSPNQQNALVMAPCLFPGLPSCSVGSHRFAVALDGIALRRNLVPAELALVQAACLDGLPWSRVWLRLCESIG